jgi:hypothetical protein
MHDNDTRNDSRFELVNPRELEQRPIGLCTLSDIITHLYERYDAIAVSAINRGDSIPVLTAVWGNDELRQTMMAHMRDAIDITPAENDGVDP